MTVPSGQPSGESRGEPARAGPETRRATMSETYVTLWGNIATDPKSLSTAAGVRMTKFRLACTPSRRDAQTGEFTDGTTSWYSVVCWRDLAVNVAASLTKGDPVVVYGK